MGERRALRSSGYRFDSLYNEMQRSREGERGTRMGSSPLTYFDTIETLFHLCLESLPMPFILRALPIPVGCMSHTYRTWKDLSRLIRCAFVHCPTK